MSTPKDSPDYAGLTAAERATRRAGADGQPVAGVSPTLILGAVALGVVLLGIIVYVLLPAEWVRGTPEPPVYKERVLKINPLREELAAIAGTEERYLEHDGNAYLKKCFIQNDSIFRYQVLIADFVNAGNNAYTVRLANRRRLLDAVRRDTVLAPVLRKASAIYIDVYDQDDAYFFSYDVTPADVWE